MINKFKREHLPILIKYAVASYEGLFEEVYDPAISADDLEIKIVNAIHQRIYEN